MATAGHDVVHIGEDAGWSILIDYIVCRSLEECDGKYAAKLQWVSASLGNHVLSSFLIGIWLWSLSQAY